jgi:hypothetical protein
MAVSATRLKISNCFSETSLIYQSAINQAAIRLIFATGLSEFRGKMRLILCA